MKTNKSTELQIRSTTIMDLVSNLQEKKDVAKILVASGLLPTSVTTPEKALAIMFKAQELGVPIMQGFASMPVINQKVTLQGDLMLALITRSKLAKKITIKETATDCTVFMSRNDMELEYESKFSLGDAKAAGLLNKDIWKKYPKVMKKWRAVSGCARVVFPDVIGGMYTPEEIFSVADIQDVDYEEAAGKVKADDFEVDAEFQKMEDDEHPDNLNKADEPAEETTVNAAGEDQEIGSYLNECTDLDLLIQFYNCLTDDQKDRWAKKFTETKHQLEGKKKGSTPGAKSDRSQYQHPQQKMDLEDPENFAKPDWCVQKINSFKTVAELKDFQKKRKTDIQMFTGDDFEKVVNAMDVREGILKANKN